MYIALSVSTSINLLPLCPEVSPGKEGADHRWAGCLETGRRGASPGVTTEKATAVSVFFGYST